ncbi:MAG: outer membrane protein assembly factor BamD [Candidimonas sp.]|uniref:Outer membrane protein assembly factor BamD n=1 Tax=Pollutimonas thiosulfatoxidans TaxID=2028345 RepID=A0A410GBY6_9BURK|nr:outer membrane protein assembly factor BamD [Candidimonas sp.]NYT44690.1 outer membrane protein assembly factor BamD [Alcaligenaceae bacterium]QAA93794.1 outer membrane protein assembly factor BamD [Pollutimonas thiosulfatoxidans]
MTRTDSQFSGSSGLARLGLTLLALLAIIVIAGCGTVKGDQDKTAGWSAERLYQDAREETSAGNWKEARARLEAIEARYPFGTYAQQALVDQAYVNWKDEEPEQALAAIDRFQQQYPNHPGTDYMLYLKGLITFTPPSAAFSNITRQDPSERDPKGLRESYESFNELIERYPDSRYAADARKRVTWLVSTIAQNEVHVAQYYYERGAYVAAVNRAQTVITDFQGVPIAEKALYIMMLSYDKLGMTELRDDAKRVLDQNFPDSKYYARGLDEPGGSKWNPINWL